MHISENVSLGLYDFTKYRYDYINPLSIKLSIDAFCSTHEDLYTKNTPIFLSLAFMIPS